MSSLAYLKNGQMHFKKHKNNIVKELIFQLYCSDNPYHFKGAFQIPTNSFKSMIY